MPQSSAIAGPRFAVYYAPPSGSPLWRFGCAILGRDAGSGEATARAQVAGFAADRLAAITADAAFYGFHATLKPPFALTASETAEGLQETARAFAAQRQPFLAPALELGCLGGFVALMLDRPSPRLQALADDCVRAFDAFRAPSPAAEIAQRRQAGLSPPQDAHLIRWGYPYVFDCWRFHMTLSCRLDDRERIRLLQALRPLALPAVAQPVTIDAICLFHQDRRTLPFRLLARFPFGSSGG
jgi:putative phosphonate metabolism protein